MTLPTLPPSMGRHPRMGVVYEVVEDWAPSEKFEKGRGRLMAGDQFIVQQADIDFLGNGHWVKANVALLSDGEVLLGEGARREVYAPPTDPVLRVRPIDIWPLEGT